MKKGYAYTLEFLIAISLVFIVMVFVFKTTPIKPELELSLIKTQGFESLDFMEKKGSLRMYVNNDDESSLESELKTFLSSAIGFESDICNYNCSTLNVPANRTVIAVDYYTATYKSNYIGKKVRLWLWLK